MKKSIATLLCILVMILTYGRGHTAPQLWKIGHVRPSGSAIDNDVHTFVDRIKNGTNGAIDIEIYPGNKLGDYSVVQERVSFGEVEMYVGPFGTAIDRRIALAFTPFLVSTWEEARKVYAPGSPLLKQMAGFMEAQNIKILGGWPVYFGGIALTKKPPSPENPDIPKETIIRVPPIRCFEHTAQALGFTPYPITWTYARMGLKTGMVEGILGGGAEGYLGLKGLIKYYLPIKDHFEYWFVYMNLDRWDSLSKQDQALFRQTAEAMESNRYDRAEADERTSLQQLQGSGIEIIALDEQALASIRAKVQKSVWPAMRQDIGEAFDTIVAGTSAP